MGKLLDLFNPLSWVQKLASIAVSQYVHQQTATAGAAERAITGLFEKLAPDLARMLETSQKPVKRPAKARQMTIEG